MHMLTIADAIKNDRERYKDLMTLSRLDGVTIDATAPVPDARPNLFAVGHLVNHPSGGLSSNVIPMPYNMPLPQAGPGPELSSKPASACSRSSLATRLR